MRNMLLRLKAMYRATRVLRLALDSAYAQAEAAHTPRDVIGLLLYFGITVNISNIVCLGPDERI